MKSISIHLPLLAFCAFATSAQAATLADLAHRWDFDGDGNDRVGTAHATLHGTASVSGGQLLLPGGTPRSNYASVTIGETIAASNSLTVETWFTTNANQDWSKAWMFGTGEGNYIDFTPRRGADGNTTSASFKTPSLNGGNEVNTTQGAHPNPAPLDPGTFLATVTYDDGADLISLYINGALVDSVEWTGTISSLGVTDQNFFGAAVHYGDGDLNGSIDELRIWTTALSAEEVLRNATAGPNLIGVPEPSAALLGGLGALALLRRRKD